MTLSELRDTLADDLKIPVALYGYRGGLITETSIVVGVTGENAYSASNVRAERVTEVAIDLYIADASESPARALETELITLDIPFRLNTTIFESDTNLVHYEYVAEV